LNAARCSVLAAACALLLAGSARPAGAGTLLVANKAEATVSLIDLGTGKVVVTLPVGKAPHEVAVSPSGKRALVANYGDREQPGSTLTVLDVPGGRVEKTVDLGEHRRPHGMVWLDERRALVTSETSHALLEVDVDAGDVGDVGKITAVIATDQEGSHMVVASPDGSRAFVANVKSGSMTALDLQAKKRLANVPAAAGTEGIAVTPGGRQVWVTNREADSVSVIDAETLKVLATLPSPSLPIRAKATPDGRRVLVTNARSGDLSVFSVADRKLERRVPLGLAGKSDHPDLGDGSLPVGLVIAPDGKRAYVAHTNADQISVLDLETWKQVGALTAGKEPDGMAFSPVEVKAAPNPPSPPTPLPSPAHTPAGRGEKSNASQASSCLPSPGDGAGGAGRGAGGEGWAGAFDGPL
jgi:YVTN family beta-propeller protein